MTVRTLPLVRPVVKTRGLYLRDPIGVVTLDARVADRRWGLRGVVDGRLIEGAWKRHTAVRDLVQARALTDRALLPSEEHRRDVDLREFQAQKRTPRPFTAHTVTQAAGTRVPRALARIPQPHHPEGDPLMPRHPVHELLAECAYHGRRPSADELDALKLTPGDRRAVQNVAAEAAELHGSGHRGRANEHALSSSRDLIASLPESQRDPTYLHQDPLADLTHPADLADAVLGRR